MKTQASPLRLIVASVISLLLLAIAIPSLGRISPDHKIVYGWRDALAVASILVPLVLIFIGAAYSKIIEMIGWALWLALLFLFIVSMATR